MGNSRVEICSLTKSWMGRLIVFSIAFDQCYSNTVGTILYLDSKNKKEGKERRQAYTRIYILGCLLVKGMENIFCSRQSSCLRLVSVVRNLTSQQPRATIRPEGAFSFCCPPSHFCLSKGPLEP